MPTITRAMTAAELAEILLSYGDLPIVAQVVDVCDGNEVGTVLSDVPVQLGNGRTMFGLQVELHTDVAGRRFAAVTGFREGC